MTARLGSQAVRVRPAIVAALRTGCRKDSDGVQVGGAVPKLAADYLERKGLAIRPSEDNPWWILTTASGYEMLQCVDAS